MFGFMITTSNDTCLKSQHQISKMMGVRHLGFVGQYVIICSKLPHNLNPRGQIIQKSTFIHKCGPLNSKFEFLVVKLPKKELLFVTVACLDQKSIFQYGGRRPYWIWPSGKFPQHFREGPGS